MSVEAAQIALSKARLVIHSERFVLAAFDVEEFGEFGPKLPQLTAGTKPFLVFRDTQEVTLVFSEACRPDELALSRRCDEGWRLMTFSPVLEMTLVGFIALVGRVMAEADVPILALSSFSRDHLLIKEEHLDTAVRALTPHVAGVDQ
ncbi:MAG: ACT domain-containing protein [Chloracidobacterium sp.]|nr:ACT domain-containing protein [Chloracidobacterium sp.]